MADYKQLKTITIDGETMGMQEGLGLNYVESNTRTGAVSADTFYDGASKSITEGAYFVRASVEFPQPSTTGATKHSVQIYAGSTLINSVSQVDANNSSVRVTCYAIVSVSADSTVKVRFSCSKAIAASSGLTSSITVTKLVRIPTTS